MPRCNALVISAALACFFSAPAVHADILASDSYNLSSYTAGGLNGQTVGGTGFTGTWAQTLEQDLTVVDSSGNGIIGRPTVTAGNAGDRALFANSGFTISSGQLFISYDINSAATLNSSRIDLNIGNLGQAAYLGGLGFNADYNFATSGAFGSAVTAQTTIPSVGAHQLVGVLDFTNDQISIYVDPTGASFYNPDGTNNANATTAWIPASSPTLTGYDLVENLSDQATFDNVVFSTDGGSVGIGETSTPEPGSVALLIGMGVTGAGVLVRRRRNACKAV